MPYIRELTVNTIECRYNAVQYCQYINNYRSWGRISIRCWIHKRHHIPRPNGRAMGCLVPEYLWENWSRYNGTAHKQQSDRWRSRLLSQRLVIRIEVPDGLWLTTVVFLFLNNQLWLSDFSLCLLHEHWQQCLEKEWQKWGVVKFVNIVGKLCWPSCIESAAEILVKDGSSKVAWPLKSWNISLFFTCPRATMKIEEFLRVAGYLYACIYGTPLVLRCFSTSKQYLTLDFIAETHRT